MSGQGWRDSRSRKRPWRDEERGRKRIQHTDTRHDSASEPPGSLRYRVPRADDLVRQEQRCSFSKPTEIGYFSKYAHDEVRFDRSNLVSTVNERATLLDLQYKEPTIGTNLMHGIESYVPKEELNPDAHPAPIGPILSAIQHFQGHLTDRSPHFVTFRNNLNKIMGTPYNTSSEWTFLAEKRNGCVYLDVHRTQSELDRNRSVHENQRRGAYAGRQFEIVSTHGKPSGSNDDSGDQPRRERVVNEDEEYCGLFASTLSGKRLIVAAEIDCFDGSKTNYVELKTFRVLQREKDQFVFERFKLLAFWIQSFIVGIPKIVCGFRNDAFEICKLQTFTTTDIPSFCRKYWSPTACLNFTSNFLDWVYAAAQEGHVYQVTYSPRQHVIDMVDLASTSRSSPSSATSSANAVSEASFLPAAFGLQPNRDSHEGEATKVTK